MRNLFLIFLSTLTLSAGIGHISAMRGDVTIERGGQKIPASKGFEIEEQDTILTTKKSKAQLKFEDNTVIRVGRNAVFKIEEYLYDKSNNSKAKFKAKNGFFSAVTGGIGKVAKDRFKLKTKTSTIGIRGTHFQGTVDDLKGEEEIACLRGAISVEIAGQLLDVEAGEIMNIKDGVSSPVRKIQSKDIKSMETKSISKSNPAELSDVGLQQQAETMKLIADSDAKLLEYGKLTAEMLKRHYVESDVKYSKDYSIESGTENVQIELYTEDSSDMRGLAQNIVSLMDYTIYPFGVEQDELLELFNTQTDGIKELAESDSENGAEIIEAVNSIVEATGNLQPQVDYYEIALANMVLNSEAYGVNEEYLVALAQSLIAIPSDKTLELANSLVETSGNIEVNQELAQSILDSNNPIVENNSEVRKEILDLLAGIFELSDDEIIIEDVAQLQNEVPFDVRFTLNNLPTADEVGKYVSGLKPWDGSVDGGTIARYSGNMIFASKIVPVQLETGEVVETISDEQILVNNGIDKEIVLETDFVNSFVGANMEYGDGKFYFSNSGVGALGYNPDGADFLFYGSNMVYANQEIFGFDGDVYLGFQFGKYTGSDLENMSAHVAIIDIEDENSLYDVSPYESLRGGFVAEKVQQTEVYKKEIGSDETFSWGYWAYQFEGENEKIRGAWVSTDLERTARENIPQIATASYSGEIYGTVENALTEKEAVAIENGTFDFGFDFTNKTMSGDIEFSTEETDYSMQFQTANQLVYEDGADHDFEFKKSFSTSVSNIGVEDAPQFVLESGDNPEYMQGQGNFYGENSESIAGGFTAGFQNGDTAIATFKGEKQ
ncbi:hypothetical protein ThvES_00015610 [Thiovulum sp. ES]|nr:hypothetical protein ThvES_00015610 [Thiovulum sp. ES]